jgi:hypothetical protein
MVSRIAIKAIDFWKKLLIPMSSPRVEKSSALTLIYTLLFLE